MARGRLSLLSYGPHARLIMAGCLLFLLSASVSLSQTPRPPVSPDPLQLQSDDNQWVMPAKNYASTRYSGLDRINTANVKRLQPAWTFSTGAVRGHEAAPPVVDHTIWRSRPHCSCS
jgi:lanthanide-dependent methanol dehydrogenase